MYFFAMYSSTVAVRVLQFGVRTRARFEANTVGKPWFIDSMYQPLGSLSFIMSTSAGASDGANRWEEKNSNS